MVSHFGGELWPSRLMGFSIGAIVFSYMAHLWFQEPFTLKTLICLGLAFCNNDGSIILEISLGS
jgi:multidrug transporter EmrE-like cation transporter